MPIFLASCGEELAEPILLPGFIEQYQPLELGVANIYAVDSIVLTPTVSGIRYDTVSLQARETLVESFTGVDGAATYRGERWERSSSSDDWRFRRTYTLTVQPSALLRSSDNLTFTKLVVPAREGITWDGNSFINENRSFPVGGEFLDVYKGWNYRYTNVDTSLTTAGGLPIEQGVVVRQAEVENAIDLRLAYEIYAPGIGPVERFLDARHTQCVDCCNRDLAACQQLPWDEKAEKGVIVRERFLSRM